MGSGNAYCQFRKILIMLIIITNNTQQNVTITPILYFQFLITRLKFEATRLIYISIVIAKHSIQKTNPVSFLIHNCWVISGQYHSILYFLCVFSLSYLCVSEVTQAL